MTHEQKQKINDLRAHGMGYKKIAAELSLSENTVKSYCRRNGITATDEKLQIQEGVCQHCGDEVQKRAGAKFCSDECRREWWKANEHLINRRAYYSATCACCGRDFKSYGNQTRKYCGHACYIQDRFSKEACNYDARAI